MPENLIPPSDGLGPGQTLRIASLAPLYDPDRHQIYYDMLERAIATGSTRNVALTGAYGTGKSSVLQQLATVHNGRVIHLSLSTIAPAEHKTGSERGEDERTVGTRTSLIQKEIVKQLLYRLPPESVPRSRFRRASTPDRRRDWLIAGVIGASAVVLLSVLGLIHPLIENFFAEWWRQLIGYLLALAAATGLAWGSGALVRWRPRVTASVQAGAATVTLSKNSDSYFDEYLDEIVYFFEASGRDIVVIEDIDRFEDVQIFDTLRTLNGLLNTAEQIGRRVVFIYAIRDSVFNQIGAQRVADPTEDVVADDAKAAIQRASRTKFFDVIIPVVPFVSADNARDVMSEAMLSDDFEINPALIRLAARHVADMRLIHNIRNEFEVYRNRLVVPKTRIPGITDDLVFAIVLFKNTHLEDFEKIRHRDSTLDMLYGAWRALVRLNLTARAGQIRALRQQQEREATSKARAASLGRKLLEYRDSLATAATASGATVELVGPVTADAHDDPEAWARIAAGEPEVIRLTSNRPYPVNLAFTAEQLGTLLAREISVQKENSELREIARRLSQAEEEVEVLRHHTWEELCERSNIRVETGQLDPVVLRDQPSDALFSFSEIVDSVLTSDLARELVHNGFLTSHFALYASSYYGTHVGPDALEYIRRCIEPGVPDATFALSEEDVVQLLREQGAENDFADLLRDASILNVSIIDYLLAKRSAAAAVVAHRLAQLGADEREFLGIYMVQGQHPDALLAAMAPHWDGIIQYAAVDAPVDASARPTLLNSVLGIIEHGRYPIDADAASVFEESYRRIETVTQPATGELAEYVMDVLDAGGVSLESLEALSDVAQRAAVKRRLFPITAGNLRALVPAGPIGLDTLSVANHSAYEYSLDRLGDYLGVVASTSFGVEVIQDPNSFVGVLNEASKRSGKAALARLIDASPRNCRAPDLADTPVDAWPSLVAGDRTDPTFANVSDYIEQYGFDQNLGVFLKKQKKIIGGTSASIEERQEVAGMILAAREKIPSTYTRVGIASSVQPGPMDAAKIAPESSDLVARLLARRLISDDATAFSSRLMIDWATLERTIAASKDFPTFASSDILSAKDVPGVLRSKIVSQTVKTSVANDIEDYLVDGSQVDTRAIATAFIEGGWRLRPKHIIALKVAGAANSQLVKLIAKVRDLSVEQMKDLFSVMGGDYQLVAVGGRGKPKFDPNSAHEELLSRLLGDTLTSVERKEFKLYGERLVATLRRPA